MTFSFGRLIFFIFFLLLERPLLEFWSATQACVLTGNRTSNPLVRRLALSSLSHTSQGLICFLS